MAVTESDVLAALRTVMDPEVFKDLVTLQQVKSVKVCEGMVSVEVSTPSPMKDRLRQEIAAAISKIAGVEEVFVNFATSLATGPQGQKAAAGAPAAPAPHRHGPAAGGGGPPAPRGIPGVKHIVAVG